MDEGTAQKYCLIYVDNGVVISEVFDYKRELRKVLKSLSLDAVKLIIKGRLIPVREEKSLTL